MGWNQLKVGAGGQLSSIDIAPDGTMVVRADIYGAYIWNPSAPNPGNNSATVPLGCWQQLANSIAVPVPLPVYPGNDGGPGVNVYEIRVAPSNPNHLYMYLGDGYGWAYFYSSLNKGGSWARQANAPNAPANSNDNSKFCGPFMAVDPHNENIVFLGTPANGIWTSANGGSTWVQISTSVIPASNAAPSGAIQNGGHTIAFDDTTWSSGNTQVIYASSYGNGVYKSTNGGGAWTPLNSSGMPTVPCKLKVDRAGVLWVIGGDLGNPFGILYKYKSGAWTNISDTAPIPSDPHNILDVTFDPSSSAAGRKIIAISPYGPTWVSTNEGGSWSGECYNPTRSAADVPWIQIEGSSSFTVAKITWHTDGNVYMASGTGVWYTAASNIPAAISPPPVWTSRSIGIEMLVNTWIVSPPGGTVICTFMDRPVFNPNFSTYPVDYGINHLQTICHGRSASWPAGTPSFIAVLAGGGNVSTGSGYSLDSGVTWNLFPVQPGTAPGGCIAAATTNNIVVNTAFGLGMFYTANRGASWTACGGINPAGGWFSFGQDIRRNNIIADKVNIGTFYGYCDGTNTAAQAMGFYKSTDGGANWSMYLAGVYHSGYTAFGGNADTASPGLQMRAVPGVAGNFFCTRGAGSVANGYPFYEFSETGSTLTRTRVIGVDSVWSFGYGAAKPGGPTYPSIYIYGVVAAAQDVGGIGGQGVWRSDDHAVHWKRLSPTSYPLDSLDAVEVVEGDANTYGTVYVGFNGSGVVYYTEDIILPSSALLTLRYIKKH